MEARYSLPGIFDGSPSLDDIFLATLHQRAPEAGPATGGVAGFIGGDGFVAYRPSFRKPVRASVQGEAAKG